MIIPVIPKCITGSLPEPESSSQNLYQGVVSVSLVRSEHFVFGRGMYILPFREHPVIVLPSNSLT